jgi:hypothetical protein
MTESYRLYLVFGHLMIDDLNELYDMTAPNIPFDVFVSELDRRIAIGHSGRMLREFANRIDEHQPEDIPILFAKFYKTLVGELVGCLLSGLSDAKSDARNTFFDFHQAFHHEEIGRRKCVRQLAHITRNERLNKLIDFYDDFIKLEGRNPDMDMNEVYQELMRTRSDGETTAC